MDLKSFFDSDQICRCIETMPKNAMLTWWKRGTLSGNISSCFCYLEGVN